MAQTTDYINLQCTGLITSAPATLCGMFVSQIGTTAGQSRVYIYDGTSTGGTEIITNYNITAAGYINFGNVNAHSALYAGICGSPYITFCIKQSD